MTDQSLFNEQTSQTPAPQATPQTNSDPFADMLKEIKNEKGEQKYKTLNDALNALKHSQEYIPSLTTQLSQKDQELAEAKAALLRMSELEDTVKGLVNKPAETNITPTNGKQFTEDDIAQIVNATLLKQVTETKQKENIDSVVEVVKAKFGDKANEVFYAKASELGFSQAEFNALAAKSPKVVLTALGIGETTLNRSSSPTIGTVNTASFPSNPTSAIGRNVKPILIGATTQDLNIESENSRKMVEELHAQGKSVHDLTDPKVYFKTFK